jgi:hypothetical protein
MMSSSDSNDPDDDESGSDSTGPRLPTPRFLPDPVSPPGTSCNNYDITYDLARAQMPDPAAPPGATQRQPLPPSGANVLDSAYRHGRLVADTPTVSRYTAEEKEAINGEIDRPHMERDVRDNIAAQEEIARELAKPWLNKFPSDCIPHDNDQMFDLEGQRNIVEHDLNCSTSHVALDGTPLDPAIDRDDLFHALNVRYNNLNRAMYTVFAIVLQNAALSATARISRKRRASAESQPPITPDSIQDGPDR